MRMDYLTPVKNRLDEFVDYLESIESFFEQEDTKLNDLHQSIEESGGEPIEAWVEYYWLTTKKDLMRMSLFISLYAFLESILHQLCEYEQILRDIICLPADIRGNGIDRSRIYLTKILGVDFPENSVHWQKIKKLQKLRNHLTHKGLNLQLDDRNHKILIQFVSRDPHLQMGEGHLPTQSDTKAPKLSDEEIESIIKLLDKKTTLTFQGFLGDRTENFSYDSIRFEAEFCKEVINTIDSFWRELIAKL